MSVCVLIRAFVVVQSLTLYHPCHTFLLEVGEVIFKFHFYILHVLAHLLVTSRTDILTFFPPAEALVLNFIYYNIKFCVLTRSFVIDQNLSSHHPCHTFLLDQKSIKKIKTSCKAIASHRCLPDLLATSAGSALLV